MTEQRKVGDELPWMVASLVIRASPETVEHVSRRLGAAPQTRQTLTRSKDAQVGVWEWESMEHGARGLNDHIAEVLEFVRMHEEELKLLAAEYPIDLICGFGSANDQAWIEIDPSSLKILGTVGISLVLDLYMF